MINLDWPTGRWVKTYVSDDSALWKRLGFEARAVLAMLWRKMDQGGAVRVSTESAEERDEDVAALLCGAPVAFVHTALEELLRRKVLVVEEGALRCPEFLEAQEARSVAAVRKQESRAARRGQDAPAVRPVLDTPAQPPPAQPVQDSPGQSGPVQDSPGHVTSRVEERRIEEIPPLSPPGGPAEKSVSSAPQEKPAELTAPAALAILAKAAGPRLVLHPPGRPYASETGLAPDDESSWCYAWHKLREAWGEADLKALGEEIAAGRLWAHLKRGVSAAYLLKHLADGLQQAAAPAPVLPAPPDPRPPPRPHTKTTPQRISLTLEAQPEDPARSAEQLQRGKALLARLGVKLPPEAIAAMGGEEAGHAG